MDFNYSFLPDARTKQKKKRKKDLKTTRTNKYPSSRYVNYPRKIYYYYYKNKSYGFRNKYIINNNNPL